jgi:hypothetical protein
MTVVESAAGELAARRRRTRRRVDRVLILGVILGLQLAWLGALAYGVYLVAS